MRTYLSGVTPYEVVRARIPNCCRVAVSAARRGPRGPGRLPRGPGRIQQANFWPLGPFVQIKTNLKMVTARDLRRWLYYLRSYSAPQSCCTHTHDFTFELSISLFSVNVRSDPITAAALSYSERLALAAVGRGTLRASNDHAAARFRARRRDCGGGLRVPRGALD